MRSRPPWGEGAAVASALEGGVEEGVDDDVGFPLGYETGREHEDVGVVVLLGQGGDLGLPAEGGAYALMLVEGHRDSVAGAAHGDAERAVALLYRNGAWMRVVGIIARLRGVSAEINCLVAARTHHIHEMLLEFVAGVVACECDFHRCLIYLVDLSKYLLLNT